MSQAFAPVLFSHALNTAAVVAPWALSLVTCVATLSLHQSHCTTHIASLSSHHSHRATLIAPLSLHHSHCTTHIAPLSLHHSHCTTLIAPLSLHHSHCTTLIAPLSLQHSHCTTLIAPLSLHHSQCTTLITPPRCCSRVAVEWHRGTQRNQCGSEALNEQEEESEAHRVADQGKVLPLCQLAF